MKTQTVNEHLYSLYKIERDLVYDLYCVPNRELLNLMADSMRGLRVVLSQVESKETKEVE